VQEQQENPAAMTAFTISIQLQGSRLVLLGLILKLLWLLWPPSPTRSDAWQSELIRSPPQNAAKPCRQFLYAI
jgi:hypothetical protein